MLQAATSDTAALGTVAGQEAAVLCACCMAESEEEGSDGKAAAALLTKVVQAPCASPSSSQHVQVPAPMPAVCHGWAVD